MPIEKNVDEKKEGMTPIQYAVARGNLEMIEPLLKKGSDPLGRTPLHYAAAHGDKKIMEVLLRGGEKIDAKDTDAKK